MVRKIRAKLVLQLRADGLGAGPQRARSCRGDAEAAAQQIRRRLRCCGQADDGLRTFLPNISASCPRHRSRAQQRLSRYRNSQQASTSDTGSAGK